MLDKSHELIQKKAIPQIHQGPDYGIFQIPAFISGTTDGYRQTTEITEDTEKNP